MPLPIAPIISVSLCSADYANSYRFFLVFHRSGNRLIQGLLYGVHRIDDHGPALLGEVGNSRSPILAAVMPMVLAIASDLVRFRSAGAAVPVFLAVTLVC
jgi:hypothetical protein